MYGADQMLVRVVREIRPIAEPIVVVESDGELVETLRALPCEVIVRELGVLRRRYMNPAGWFNRAYHNLAAALWMARLIRQRDIQAVVTSTVSVTAGALAAKLARRPHLWFVQEILSGYASGLASLVSGLSTTMVAVSKASAESIHRGRAGVAERIQVLYPGVDPRRFQGVDGRPFRSRYCPEPNQVLIGLVARLHAWKGQDYFLEALGDLKRRGVGGFRAVLVGEAYQDYPEIRPRLEAKARALGLGEVVTFCGHLDGVAGVFAGLDFSVAPSVKPEPFGLVVAEAMASRRPVIATHWGGPKEMIEDGVSGYLVPPNDVPAFSHRLEQLIVNPALRRQMGEAARRRIETAFQAETFNERMRAAVAALAGRA